MSKIEPKLRVLSLGAGVQSTTMALMAAHGEIGPMPDCAIFADTGWEPKSVYDHLALLRNALPFEVHLVSRGNLRQDILSHCDSTGQRLASVPWFLENGGMARRQCTSEYKINPIRKKIRELSGYAPKKRIPIGSVEVWIGISTDEIQRMKESRDRWQTNRWPLIESRLSRSDCISWLSTHGWTAPKSACIGCPYHSDAMWRDMRKNDPESWEDAIKVDRKIRNGIRNFRHQQFMHRSRKPLDQVDFCSLADKGQIEFGFVQECDGMCGV